MVWELLPVPFSGSRVQHGVGAVSCSLSREEGLRGTSTVWELLPVPFSGFRLQYCVGVVALHVVGAVACALFRDRLQHGVGAVTVVFRVPFCPGSGSSMVWELLPVPFSGIDSSMMWELLPASFSGRGLVAGQEGLIQLCFLFRVKG